MLPYMPANKVFMIPENPMFSLMYGATPQLANPGANTLTLMASDYFLSEYLNAEEKYHKFYVESAPLPVPVTPDRMYTLQPIA